MEVLLSNTSLSIPLKPSSSEEKDYWGRVIAEAAVLTDLLQAGLTYTASVTGQLADELENRPSDAYHRTDIAHVLYALYAEHQGQPA